MKTVQMTLNDDLIREVDKLAKKLHTTRSGFARAALKKAVRQYESYRMELKHRKGYERLPVDKDEFSAWENEQEWGDL